MAPGYLLLGLIAVAAAVAAVMVVLRMLRRRREVVLVPLEAQDHDQAFREAVAQARRTLPAVVKRFRRSGGEGLLAVKAIFKDRGAVEAMWVRVSRVVDDEVDGSLAEGVLDNVPRQIRNLCLGDPVRIPLGQVIDWMTGDGDVYKGGYTVAALARRAETRRDVPLPFDLKDEASRDIEFGVAEAEERVEEKNETTDEHE